MIRRISAASCALIAALLIFALSPAFAGGGHTVITGPELEAMMKDGKPVVIVDVREPVLFARGHVPGAINIPYETARGRILKELSPKDRIVFICHGGPMGDELGEVLVNNGYKSVYNVKGGMKQWSGPLTR